MNSPSRVLDTNESSDLTSQTASDTVTDECSLALGNDYDKFRQALCMATNRERDITGLPPLVMDPVLVQVAQDHADDMFANNYLSYIGLDGSTLEQRLANAGATPGISSENIAEGPGSATAVVNSFMNSTRTSRNVSNGAFNFTGVGYAEGKWVQIFTD